MPDHRQHRGAHPQDLQLFAARHLPALRQAVADLSWLLSRDYAVHSALKLVGDRYGLMERQRLAVARAACSDQQQEYRRQSCLAFEQIQGQRIVLDGFNLIITVEAALSGGAIVLCRDGCLRDLSSVHGSYRQVSETEAAICLLSEILLEGAPESALWLLDQPVSNSGRLAHRIRTLAEQNQWPWEVEVVMNPDKTIQESRLIAATSDSNVLDGVEHWVNLTNEWLPRYQSQVWLLDLATASD
jgi:hypothetical protein